MEDFRRGAVVSYTKLQGVSVYVGGVQARTLQSKKAKQLGGKSVKGFSKGH